MTAPTRPLLSDADLWGRACEQGIPISAADPRIERWYAAGRITRIGDRWWGDRRAQHTQLTAEQRAAAAEEAAWKRRDDR